MALLGSTGIDAYPLWLGGSVFGWTADESRSVAVLDAYVAEGGNAIDTADAYTWWADGNAGGESETIIGRWMRSRRNRERVVLATKVGNELPGQPPSLAAEAIRTRMEASLRRLQTEYVDLLYAHVDDPATPLEETLGAFDEIVQAGKARVVAASNYKASRLAEALRVSDANGWARFAVLTTSYSLVRRENYEGELAALCEREGIPCPPYWGLANGFLTGKYRPGVRSQSVRAEQAMRHLDARGAAVLAALDQLAAARRTTVAAVALAWLLAQPTVRGVIASARTPEQLADLVPSATLELGESELELLADASLVPAATRGTSRAGNARRRFSRRLGKLRRLWRSI